MNATSEIEWRTDPALQTRRVRGELRAEGRRSEAKSSLPGRAVSPRGIGGRRAQDVPVWSGASIVTDLNRCVSRRAGFLDHDPIEIVRFLWGRSEDTRIVRI